MAARLTIATVDHLADLNQAQPITIDLLQNGRSRLRFTCLPHYQPARFAEVVAYAQDGATPIYGGLILQRSMAGLAPHSDQPEMVCECVGFEAYLDWCYLDLAYTTDPTLQEVLDDLVAALPAGYGITLDATDYSAITLAAFTWQSMRASDGLRELCDRTGRIYRVSPTKELALPLPGGEAAPADFTDATPNCEDLLWQDAATPPATTIRLWCGTGTAFQSQGWVGTDRIDDPGGEYSYFEVPYNTPADLNGTWPNVVSVTGQPAFSGPVLWGADAGHTWLWSWDYVNHRLQWDRTIGGDFDDAWVIPAVNYTAQYPFLVTATTGGSPDIAVTEARPDVFDLAQGQEIADGLLATLGGSPRTLEATTRVEGWAPGQAVTVDLAGRAVDATFAVTDVTIQWQTAGIWLYTVRATELSVFPGNYLDQWRALLGADSFGVVAPASASSGVSVLSSPGTYYLGGSRTGAVQVPA